MREKEAAVIRLEEKNKYLKEISKNKEKVGGGGGEGRGWIGKEGREREYII